MKVTLINPPFEERYSVGSSRSIKHILNVIPPLGLAYLAAVLEKNNFAVNIIDGSIEPDTCILKRIAAEQPGIIGISASTATFPAAESLTQSIRQVLPQSIIVLGGAHISALPYQAMKSTYFDVGVLGEGEETFLDLVTHIAGNGLDNLERIKGVVFRRNGTTIVTGKRDFILDLDKIPFPARHLLPALSRYRPTPASYKRLPLGIIISSRGCPCKCTFCDRAVFGNAFRSRSAENLLAEIEEVVHKYGCREIRFFDDCFTLDNPRAYAICQGIKRKRLKIPWTCLTTVNSVTEDLLREMKSAGCWQVLFGLESGDERMLGLLKKGASLEQNIQAVRWAKAAGLSVRADFIIGTPGETPESFQRTLNFALAMQLDYAHFNKFVPYPGTALYRRLKEEGYDFDFTGGCSITDHTRFLYIPQAWREKNKYENIINYAHKKFYLRFGYILKRLFSLRTREEFIGQLRGFFAILALEEKYAAHRP